MVLCSLLLRGILLTLSTGQSAIHFFKAPALVFHLCFLFLFFNVYLLLREKVREYMGTQVGEGQRERETQNPKQAPGSQLSLGFQFCIQLEPKVCLVLESKCYVGAPGWLIPLSVQLQLRS